MRSVVCRSSEDCPEQAGHGRFGSFCAAHAAELAELRSAHFTAAGVARKAPITPEHAGPAVEDDARQLTLEVLGAGRLTKQAARDLLGFSYDRHRRAVGWAERTGWLVATPHGLIPGGSIPEGRIPKAVRAEMLARFVRQRGGTVPRSEVAPAIGLGPNGSLPRVIKHAIEQGLVTSASGPHGGITAAS